MKVRFNKATWRTGSGLLASLVLLVSFQNCGKAGFDADLESDIASGDGDAALIAKYGESTAQKVQGIPFAFDATFDTITYNSCAETALRNAPGFFTLMAGAYSTGGIKLKNEFYDYADQNFKPIYPEVRLSENQYKEYLADSPVNAKVIPNMAIRVKNSLTDIFRANANVTLWTDVVPMVGNLTDSLVMDSYAGKGMVANYFPFSPEQRVMEGTWTMNSDEKSADDIRNVFMSSGVLALTYMLEGSDLSSVKSSGSTYPYRSAYGRGYGLTFAPPGGATSNPNRILAQVLESDLSSPSVATKAWTCNRSYKVISTSDLNKNPTLCPAHTFSELKNPGVRAEMAIVRRHLRADQWDVNVIKGCAVPKGGASCYKETPVTAGGITYPVVEYDSAKECFRSNKSDYVNGVPNSNCMHYITVCTRD